MTFLRTIGKRVREWMTGRRYTTITEYSVSFADDGTVHWIPVKG